LLLGLAAFAPAINDRQKLAARAVEDVLIRQVRGKGNAKIQTFDERRLSINEFVISGRGFSRRDAIGDFTYSVKVRDDASVARDVVITLANGTRYSEPGPFSYPNVPGNGNGNGRPGVGIGRGVRIDKPTPNFRDTDGDVTFAGRAEGRSVELIVRPQRGGREVVRKSVPVKDGRWETRVFLESGEYRLSATGEGRAATDQDSVSFSVERSSNIRDKDRVVLTSPQQLDRLFAGRIRLEGTGLEEFVRVQVYDSRGNQIRDRKAPVRDGRWTNDLDLVEGSYRLRLSVPSGKATQDFDLRVSR
ncbi:MAG: hypothetical protein C4320_03975, partial [Armatimonadota bacterium]